MRRIIIALLLLICLAGCCNTERPQPAEVVTFKDEVTVNRIYSTKSGKSSRKYWMDLQYRYTNYKVRSTSDFNKNTEEGAYVPVTITIEYWADGRDVYKIDSIDLDY